MKTDELLAGYYRRQDVAEMLGKDIRTIDRWIHKGRLGYARIGGQVYIHEDHVAEFLSNARSEAWFQPLIPGL